MFIELADLGLYFVQQLGVLLSVGAQIVLLILYLLSIKDGAIDNKEQHFLSATKRILYFGVVCIVLSGILITGIHFSAAQMTVIFSPAYIFKWLLIITAIILALLDYTDKPSLAVTKGFSGAVWLALFTVHVLAPDTTWALLGILFGVWVVGFMTVWLGVTFALGGKSPMGAAVQTPLEIKPPAVAAPKPLPPPEPVREPIIEKPLPPPVPPVAPPPAPQSPPKPAFSIPTASVQAPFVSSSTGPLALHPHISEDTPSLVPPPITTSGANTIHVASDHVTEHLPALRIMPTKPEDLETQHRAPLVRFG